MIRSERLRKIKRFIVQTSILCIIAIFIVLKYFTPPEIRPIINNNLSYIILVVALIISIILYFLPDETYGKTKTFYSLTVITVLLISLLIYFTGKMQSQFFVLYLLPLIVGSIYQQMRGAIFVLFCTFSMYFLIFYLGTTPSNYEQSLLIFSYHLRFFLLTAFFTGYLIAREKRHYQRIKNLLLTILSTSTSIIDVKEFHPKGHAEEVMLYSLKIADELKLEEVEKRDLKLAALFHDVGMAKVADEIIEKNDKLSEEEFANIKIHSKEVEKLFGHIKEMENVIQGIRHIHEKYDGGGYPDELKGDEIPLLSRIISIADAYSAMKTQRPYRDKLTEEQAQKEIEKNSGTQFDPNIAKSFLKILKEEKS